MARRADWVAGMVGALALAMAVGSPANAADVAYGEYLANECVTCHQKTGNFNGIPSITGWPSETFIQALNTYRWRERKNPIMQTIADQFQSVPLPARPL